MIPTSATSPASTPSPTSAMIGIASLILEGRALSDDDFVLTHTNGDKMSSARLLNSTGGNQHYNAINISSGSNIYATDDPTVQHFQRLRQKLGQLRQSSPGTSRDNLAAEHEIIVGPSSNTLTAANRNADDSDDGELNQFVQRKSKPSSSHHNHHVTQQHQPQQQQQQIHHPVPNNDNNLLYTLQSLASTCLRTTPRSFNRNRDLVAPEFWFNSSSNTSSSSQAATMKWYPPPSIINSSNNGSPVIASGTSNININSISSNSGNTGNNSHQALYTNHLQRIGKMHQQQQQQSNKRGEKFASLKQGPHCDQFLKKLGLGKGEASEAEEHICDMANLNEICYIWHIHCRQIEVIMSRCDPICIEVYLGPESHEILLEQWIIQQGGKSDTPNMTLHSLCNAIRSQLYFSQITAWSDLIRKAKPFDKDVFENGRIKVSPSQLSSTTSSSSSSSSASPSSSSSGATATVAGNNGGGGGGGGGLQQMQMQKKPRLDIFYRIKTYDSTACFNAKPNVHNFPIINLSENTTISVRLKSLPRLQGGIPKIGDFLGSNSNNNSAVTSNNSSNTISSSIIINDGMEQHLNDTCELGDDEAMILDDRLPCQEKGKHKCVFDEEDGSSDAVGEGGSCSSVISHREKQLLKYRKRMLKRDRKTKKVIDTSPSSTTTVASLLLSPLSSRVVDQCQQMQLVDEKQQSGFNNDTSSAPIINSPEGRNSSNSHYCLDSMKNSSNGNCSNHTEQQAVAAAAAVAAMHEFGSINSINSIRPPLYQTTTIVTEAVQTNMVEMISIGTQTTVDFPMQEQYHQHYPACRNCGHDMELVCWNCENEKSKIQIQQQKKIMTNNETPQKLGKGDLLLQAIQRTPLRKNQDIVGNNNNSPDIRGNNGNSSNMSNCQLCKRQKTGHYYGSNSDNSTTASQNGFFNENNDITNSSSTTNSFLKILSKKCSSSVKSKQQEPPESHHNNEIQELKPVKFPFINKCGCTIQSSIQLKEHNCDASIQDTDRDCLPNGACVPLSSSSVNITKSKKKNKSNNNDSGNISPDFLLTTDNISAQFKTPKVNTNARNQLKPNVLPICMNINNNNNAATATMTASISSHSEKFRKSLPKVNLTNIFCSPSSPIPITSPDSFTFNGETPEIPVQKSNSAPTLPNSPSLSPRFLKQAAIYKRRSRHLSDRSSERSSFGSDEQFSDEDLDSVYSPATSPIKNKIFPRCSIFGRRPLLGNLEESLLQRRFTPKTQVSGFKVLLGASGAYCPTQLSIPAAAYFYELSGQTLSTPYVCEIRLSRKGYTIPRTGTVQATLLNPLGTVVRMFVIPYDFRDMPPMSQTFIRQRILAINSPEGGESTTINKNGNNNNDNSNNSNVNNNNEQQQQQYPSSSGLMQSETAFQDQMHSLRYSIHLRFQTSRSGRLALHTDIRFLISRRTDCDTAAAHAKGALESPNDLRVITITPENPKYSARQENPNKI